MLVLSVIVFMKYPQECIGSAYIYIHVHTNINTHTIYLLVNVNKKLLNMAIYSELSH